MNEESQSNRFSNFIAIMLAIVSIVGAVIAARVAVASNEAGDNDTKGLLAVVDREDAESRATITVFGHLTAYAAFVRDRALANTYDDLADMNPQRKDYAGAASAFRLAANYALGLIPTTYVGRDEKLNLTRDRGENIASYSLGKNTDPKPNFDDADKARFRAQLLLINIIVLGGALLMFTLADAIRNFLRWFFVVSGMTLFIIGTLSALFIELIFPYVVL